MSNFTFLKGEWPELHEAAKRAETLALPDPRGACFYARRALELAVRWLYEHDPTLLPPYDAALNALLHESTFRDTVPREVWLKARLIKDLGNEAVHSRRELAPRDAEQAVRELFHFLYWLARTYTREGAASLAGVAWNAELLSLPMRRAAERKATTQAELQRLQADI